MRRSPGGARKIRSAFAAKMRVYTRVASSPRIAPDVVKRTTSSRSAPQPEMSMRGGGPGSKRGGSPWRTHSSLQTAPRTSAERRTTSSLHAARKVPSVVSSSRSSVMVSERRRGECVRQ